MLLSFLNWLFSFKFTQQTSAALVGTGIAVVPMVGIIDQKLTKEIAELRLVVSEKATIVYVEGENKVFRISVEDLNKSLNKIEKNQEITNSQLWQLVNSKGR